MNIKLLYNLWKTQRNLNPTRSFKNELLLKLNLEQKPYHLRLYSWRMATVMVFLLLLTFSIGTFAYASPNITEGNILYPLKQKIEDVEEYVKVSPEAKAKFYAKKIKKREVEREIAEKKGKSLERINKQIKDIEKNLERTKKMIKQKNTR